MRISFLIVVSIFIASSCLEDKNSNISKSGQVIWKIQLFDSANSVTPSLTTEYRIWYKDSAAIEEVNTIRFFDSSGIKSQDVVLSHYVFIDGGSRTFCYYKSFTDTAQMVKKYIGEDSFKFHGGWNFLTDRSFEYIGTPTHISDTTMDGIIFKRVVFQTMKGENEYRSIGYFRCDRKGTLFKFDKTYSDIVGCPMTRIEEYPKTRGKTISAQIIFVSDSLSTSELKVFDAWVQNLK